MKSNEEKAIDALDSSDRVGDGAEALSVILGGAGGAASAGALAAAAGVTTIPALTSAAGWFGLTLVSATPVGWIIGAAMAGGLIFFGTSKIVRSGGKNDQIRHDIAKRLKEKLAKRHAEKACVIDLTPLRAVLKNALDRKLIEESQAEQLVLLVAQGKLSFDIAINRLSAICDAVNKR